MIVRDQEENPAKSSVVCGKGSHWGTLPPGTDVQNLSALTTATLSGPAAGLVGTQNGPFTVALNTATSTSVTVNLASNNGSDTFQATLGGGNVTSITIPAGSTTVTFYLTPGGTAGNRSISITTSPSLTYSGSPIIFDASSITIPAGSTSVTFYLTPGGTAGNRNISITTSPALTYSGSPITYSAAAAPTSATLSGPTSGIVGVESTAFTVTVNQPASTGGVTVTPASSIGSDTFQATSGGGNVFNVSGINFGTEGGTIASPTPTTLWYIQPPDTTKGPWSMSVSDTLFGTTHDSDCFWGYNIPSTQGSIASIPTEPVWRYGMEQDYYVSSNNTYSCEAYQEFINPGGTLTVRPWMCTLNRATGATDVQINIGPPGDTNYGGLFINATTSYPLIDIVGGGTSTTALYMYQNNSAANIELELETSVAYLSLGGTLAGEISLGGTGQSSTLIYANAWQFYKNPSDAHFYFRDLVNSRMQMTFTPAASGSLTTINSPTTITLSNSTTSKGLIVEAGTATATINNVAVTSNVVTITTAAAHNFPNRASVTISGLTNSQLDGTQTIASVPTTTTFTYSLVTANVSSQADSGTAVIAQTGNLQEWQNSSGSALSFIKSDGSMGLASLADSAATNNSLYYSTTSSKLCYKDSSGALHTLT